MNAKLAKFFFFTQKINRQHIQFAVALLALVLFVLGAGAPEGGSIPGPRYPVILLVAVFAGVSAGLLLARWKRVSWSLPQLRVPWLVIIAFLPQFFAFYLPVTSRLIPDGWASVGLVSSQVLLLVFCLLNRRVSGVWLLALGLGLNTLVIGMNRGFMPISPQTAGRLVPETILQAIPLGTRFGYGKDILLSPANTQLAWLSDRFLPPKGFSYQVAFSLGDIVIACGAFWLLAFPGKVLHFLTDRKVKVIKQCKPKLSNPLYL
jgi:hypothetical protein